MSKRTVILAGLLLSAPGSAFAAGVHVRPSVPVVRSNPAAVGIAAAYSNVSRSVGFPTVPLYSLMGADFQGQYRPTLAGIYLAVKAYTLKLRANVVKTFDVGNVDTATYMPTGEVAEALRTLQMPTHKRKVPKNIRFTPRRGSAMRPASANDTGSFDTKSSYLAEGGGAANAKGQLSLMHHRQQALGSKVDPSGIGRRIEGTVSFDGGRHSGVSLN